MKKLSSLMRQLADIEKGQLQISLPIVGAVLAARVQVLISAGLVDLNKHIREATVRRNVVVQLIRMHRDAGHEDYQQLNIADVEIKARQLAPTDEPCIPEGLAEILQDGAGKRPLLKKGKSFIHKLYLERKSLYEKSHMSIPMDDLEKIKDIDGLIELIHEKKRRAM